MTPEEFARKHLGEHRIKGVEIVPLLCPFCHGGKSADKFTFALNLEKRTYNCKRGSCAVTGTYKQLMDEFGERVQSFEFNRPVAKYVKPKTKVSAAKKKVVDYLKLRGISQSNWEQWGVGESGGNIVFPYYQDGELVMLKFRKPEKYTGKGPKAWREEGGKAVFWGMDKCKPGKPLIICEGEMDAMALTECGLTNIVSVPSGAEDLTCIDHCWDWLERFSKVIIWPDNDEPGQEMCRKLIQKLGAWRCAVVHTEYKDANVCLHKEGQEKVLECVEGAKDVPIAGLMRLADVKAFDYSQTFRVASSVHGVNTAIGGFMGGELSVWTGDSGSGKSTFLGQELLEAVEQGHTVCAYSGELPGPLFRYWIDLQAAGTHNLVTEADPIRERDVYYADPKLVPAIHSWYYDKFFLFDNTSGATDDKLLKVFEYAARRYDCRIFLVDNLMATAMQSEEKELLRKQADFSRQCKQFALKYEVHVHLVAHPRKAGERLTKHDVAGAKEITNWADNVFSMYRPGKDEQTAYAAILDIFKSRFSGAQEVTIGLSFDDRSKRFWLPSRSRLDYQYGWESEGKQ